MDPSIYLADPGAPIRQVGGWRQQKWGNLGCLGLTLAWCPQGSYKELVSVLIMMRHLGFAPDLLSYTSILQCMGRVDQDVTTIRR